MKRFMQLLAPVAMAAAFPVAAQTDDATTKTEEQQVEKTVWTPSKILNEGMISEVIIERDETDPDFSAAVDKLMRKDVERGILSNTNISHESYLMFIMSFVSNRIDANMLAAQPGLAAQDNTAPTLQYNYNLVIKCRDEVKLTRENKNESFWYRRHQQVRGCALEKLRNSPEPLTGLAAETEFPLAANYSLAEKLTGYQSEASQYGAYETAVIRERDNFVDQHKYLGAMYNRSAIRITHLAFDASMTYEDFKSIPDEKDDKDYEFKWRTVGSDVIDNNLKFIFECRDEILPKNKNKLEKSADRQAHLIEVFDCARQKTLQANEAEIAETERRAREIDVRVDPAPLRDKLMRYQYTDDYGNKYQLAVNDAAQSDWDNKSIHYFNGYYINHLKLWHAILDKDAKWSTLKNLRNNDNDSRNNYEYEFYWEAKAPEMSSNIKYMFECRDELVPDDLSTTDMAARRAAFDSVIDCWKNAVQPKAEKIYAARKVEAAKQQEIQKQQADEDRRTFNILLSIFGGLGILFALDKGGQAVLHKRRNRPKKLNI